MKRCPQCHSEFADQVIYCVKDGQPLEPAGGADTPSPVAGKPRPLAERLASETPMAVERAAHIVTALCAAIAEYRHSSGSDKAIDPQALFIDEPAGDAPPRVQIKAAPSTENNAAESIAPYTAPEISPQSKVSAAADVYSVGAIAYHLFTGEPPFAAASAAALRVKQLLEQPRPLIDLRPGLPPRLDAVVRRALEKEPAARPASLAQLQSEIASAVADTSAPVPAPIPQTPGEPPLVSAPMLAPPPASPPMSAPQMSPPVIAMAAPAADAPLAKAGKRKVIAAILGLVAVLSAAAALAVFFTQSRSGMSVQTSSSRAVNENGNANTATPLVTATPTNQNAQAPANSNTASPPKKAQPAPASPAPRTQPAPKEKPAAQPKDQPARPATSPSPTPGAMPDETPSAPATPNPPPPTAPRPAARMKPPISNVNPLVPMPDTGGKPAPANTNTAAKTQPRPKAKAQPRPVQPAATAPPPQAAPKPSTEPAPLTATGEVVMVSRTRQAQWLIPALLIGLALVTGIVAGLLLQSYRLKRHAAQTAAALAQAPQALAAQAAKVDEALTTPASAGETKANAPAQETQPAMQATATTIIADTTLPREVFHRCPACQIEYPLSVRFCVHDGTTLIEANKTAPPKDEPSFYDLQTLESRKYCPQCGTEYPLSKKFCRYDGGQLVDRQPPAPPPADALRMSPIVIGQYRCFARLGEGGMGIVYKAQHVHLKRLSAIKVLLPQTAILPDAVQMFRHEAQLASSINHPNSVIIYDYGELDASLFYLAMEFIAGASLAEIIAPGGVTRPVPLARALDITQQVCDALDAAHQLGIIHRDLKPHNVMVTMRASGGDFVKVVDFGIARSLKAAADYANLPGAIVGTPAYMSPEQARGASDLDARSDIYSLGVMVYQMLSGAVPFPAKGLSTWQQIDRRATLHELPPSLNDLRPDLRVPQAVNKAVMRALDPARERRFTSASDFMHDLSQAAQSAT